MAKCVTVWEVGDSDLEDIQKIIIENDSQLVVNSINQK